MKEICISPATSYDVTGIVEVFYKTWLATYPNKEAGITIEDIEDRYKNAFTPEFLKMRREQIENPKEGTVNLVAKIGNNVVGICVLTEHADKNQLQAIYILPEYQRRGIGKLFWEEVKKICNPRKDIIVHVATYNTPAIEFYKKIGFSDTGKRMTEERFKMKSGAMIPEMEMRLATQN